MEMERTSDELRRGADAAVDPYSVFSWALPVSPLVASSLSVLSYTLSPAVGPYEGGFYLAFFSAALAGFLSAMLASRASRAVSKVLCVIDALVLECAFVFFMLGWPTTQPPSGFTWAGVVMTGFSAASMLMLWLPYRPSSTMRAEMLGFAVALFAGFLIRIVQGVFPPLMLGLLFPPAAAIPLFFVLGRALQPKVGFPPENPSCPTGRAAPLAVLFVIVGMGMGLIGHGTHNADYSAGLLAVLLIAASFCRGHSPSSVVSYAAPALMVAGLCLWLLPESGAPFAVYLAGCGSFAVYLLCAVRGNALLAGALLGAATACCLVGIVVQRVLVEVFSVDPSSLVVALVMAVAAVEAVCGMLGLEDCSRLFDRMSVAGERATGKGSRAEPERGRPSSADDVARMFEEYRLSSRELDVASYLLENRSVGYICSSLGLSQSTVKTHIRHIYGKMDIHSKDELQLIADRLKTGNHP